MASIKEQLSQQLSDFKKKRGRKLGGKNRDKKQLGPHLPFMYSPSEPEPTQVNFGELSNPILSQLRQEIKTLKSLENDFTLEAEKNPARKDALMCCVYIFASKRQGLEESIALIIKAMNVR